MANQTIPMLNGSHSPNLQGDQSETLEGRPSMQQVMAIGSADEDDGYEDDEEDDSCDSESLLLDLIEDDDKTEFASERNPSICTKDEAMKYRTRVKEVGLDVFVQETVTAGVVTAKKLCTAFGARLPDMWKDEPDSRYYRLLGVALAREVKQRAKLTEFNTIDDAVALLKTCKSIMVITGAGISTNLGIPDFRSQGSGFYSKLRDEGFEDPQEIFNLQVFDENPEIFYKYAGDTLPGVGRTSPTHAFIHLLQEKSKLLTNYTQNIDNIESAAGIDSTKLIQCHGSWATATCRQCKQTVPGSEIEEDVRAKRVSRCRRCDVAGPHVGMKRKRSTTSNGRSRHNGGREDHDSDADDDMPEVGVMKPDITFFGEPLSDAFFTRFLDQDRKEVDLVLVIGTSMTVAPVSEIPHMVDRTVPQIYISHDNVKHIEFDVVLRGDCDVIVSELAKRAGWPLTHSMVPADREVTITAENEERGVWSVAARTVTAEGLGDSIAVSPRFADHPASGLTSSALAGPTETRPSTVILNGTGTTDSTSTQDRPGVNTEAQTNNTQELRPLFKDPGLTLLL